MQVGRQGGTARRGQGAPLLVRRVQPVQSRARRWARPVMADRPGPKMLVHPFRLSMRSADSGARYARLASVTLDCICSSTRCAHMSTVVSRAPTQISCNRQALPQWCSGHHHPVCSGPMTGSTATHL